MAKKDDWSRIDDIFKNLEENIVDNLSKKKLNKLANELLQMVRQRIIDGYGVAKMGGSKKKFKALAPSTKKARTYKDLSPLTAPNKSNQIESGRFIEGLNVKVTEDSIIISTSNDRVEIAKYNEEKGRPSMYLTKDEYEYFMDNFDDLVNEAISKSFK